MEVMYPLLDYSQRISDTKLGDVHLIINEYNNTSKVQLLNNHYIFDCLSSLYHLIFTILLLICIWNRLSVVKDQLYHSNNPTKLRLCFFPIKFVNQR